MTDVRHDAATAALFKAVPDAILGIDTSGRIELVNDEASRVLGWEVDDLIGKPVEVLMPAHLTRRHEQHRADFLAAPAARSMGSGLRVTVCRRDGTEFPAEVLLSPLTDDSGTVLVLAAVHDLSARVSADAAEAQRLLQAQRMESLGRLSGGVAHDFNNLLGVILNYTTLIRRRVTDPVVLGDLDEIRAAAERGAALTRQLLTFARRENARHDALEVNAVVRSVASMLGRTLGEHVVLDLQLAEGELVAECERTQLEQILLNLALNARDAMPDGGLLTVATRPAVASLVPGEPVDVVLTVSDSGHGMSPEVAARAFEPFFTTKERGRGTGLGLATVYGIVQQHRGEISVDSTEGVGTTVTVVLPGAAPASHPADPPAPPAASGGRERVLLVEDERELRAVTARMLADRGFEVQTASDGLEALAALERAGGHVDVVVTDVAMPGLRGDELCRRVAERWPDVALVVMTGYDSGGAPPPGRVLAKPVPEETMLLAIREAIDGR